MTTKKKTPKKNGLSFYSVMTPSGKPVRCRGKLTQMYKKEFRWRIYRNGRIIAASSESYKTLNHAAKNVLSIAGMICYQDPRMSYRSHVDKAIVDFKSKK